MTVPIPEPSDPINEATAQPYYVREEQDWAVEQERQRHSQALYSYGEYAMFCLMWHVRDFEAGLVQRCSRCRGDGSNAVRVGIADAYNQPTQARCPNCYGTTFEGGFKAQIIRPCIFSDADEDEQKLARGVMNPQDLSVESTTDFRVRSGDYVFRATGDRFYLRVPNRLTLRTGFAVPHQSSMAIGYNHARANQEDRTSVAYDILTPGIDPPQTLVGLLNTANRIPIDFDNYEIIRGRLIPPEDD